MSRSIYIGADPREEDALDVCLRSMLRAGDGGAHIAPLVLNDLITAGWYSRPTSRRDGHLWDDISGAPMSTEFAISRFLVPALACEGWALFMDCDVLIRGDLAALFALADPSFAIQVVQHDHRPSEAVKMDGQAQLAYPRKNWSSVVLWNVEHPANRRLTPAMVNSLPGRDLHRFCWLRDDEIGALPGRWNHLVGVDAPDPDAQIAHFTLGVPSMAGYEDCEFADEWRALCRPG